MTHFATLVIIPPATPDVQMKVAELLAPYDENGEAFADTSRWDWWQIGGRYSGQLVGHKWWMESAQYTPCKFCDGTGTRDDTVGRMNPMPREHHEDSDGCCPFPIIGTGCNACHGTGMQAPFGGPREHFEGDIVPIARIREDFRPYAVVTPDGQWHEKGRMGWWAVEIPDESGAEPKDENTWDHEWSGLVGKYAPDHIAVLVDCHV